MANNKRWWNPRWQTLIPPSRGGRQSGIGSAEFLVAVPVLLLIGLLIWQWALVLQARQIVDFAVREAARYGAVGHAEPEAIEQGLVSGLVPLWVSSQTLGSRDESLASSALKFNAATRHGWLSWRQITPTRESFQDWAVPQASSFGRSGGSAPFEIPVDNPVWRSRNAEPASGGSFTETGERVGQASGHTFREAGILRIELSVAVPLVVPLAGRFISWATRSLNGCGADDAAPRLGAVRVEAAPMEITASSPVQPIPAARDTPVSVCTLYRGADDSGRILPRIPLRASGEARMQSNARLTARTPSAGLRAPTQPDARGSSVMLATPAIASGTGDAYLSPGLGSSAEATLDASARQPGFLQIGAEREIWSPGSCGITPG